MNRFRGRFRRTAEHNDNTFYRLACHSGHSACGIVSALACCFQHCVAEKRWLRCSGLLPKGDSIVRYVDGAKQRRDHAAQHATSGVAVRGLERTASFSFLRTTGFGIATGDVKSVNKYAVGLDSGISRI